MSGRMYGIGFADGKVDDESDCEDDSPTRFPPGSPRPDSWYKIGYKDGYLWVYEDCHTDSDVSKTEMKCQNNPRRKRASRKARSKSPRGRKARGRSKSPRGKTARDRSPRAGNRMQTGNTATEEIFYLTQGS